MPITNEAELIAAAEALVPPAKVFNNTGEQINTGLDASAGRVVQPALVYHSAAEVDYEFVSGLSGVSGERLMFFQILETDKSGSIYYGGNLPSGNNLRLNGDSVIFYVLTDSGTYTWNTGETLDALGIVNVALRIYDEGGTAKMQAYWTDLPAPITIVPTGDVLSPVPITAARLMSVKFAGTDRGIIQHAYFTACTEQQMLDLVDNYDIPAVSAYYWLRCKSPDSWGDIGPQNLGSHTTGNIVTNFDVGQDHENINGYAVCTNRNNIVIPRKSNGDLITEGVITGLTFGDSFTGPVKYQLTETAGQLSIPDFGNQDYPKALVDNDINGGWHEATTFNLADFTKNTQPAQIDPSIPTLYADNFATGGGYIVCNGADLTTDIKDYLGISEPSIKLTGLTPNSKILINGVATTVAGTEHTTPALAAFTDYEIRIAHPDKKAIILSTFVSAGLKEVAVTQENLTVPLTHNGSLLTQFALNGNVLEVTDDDDTFDIQLAEAWLRFNDFDDPSNPWFSKHHLVHPAQLVVDKDMEQIVNTKVTACEVTNGVITKNVVTSPYSTDNGGFTINGVFQGEGL